MADDSKTQKRRVEARLARIEAAAQEVVNTFGQATAENWDVTRDEVWQAVHEGEVRALSEACCKPVTR